MGSRCELLARGFVFVAELAASPGILRDSDKPAKVGVARFASPDECSGRSGDEAGKCYTMLGFAPKSAVEEIEKWLVIGVPIAKVEVAQALQKVQLQFHGRNLKPDKGDARFGGPFGNTSFLSRRYFAGDKRNTRTHRQQRKRTVARNRRAKLNLIDSTFHKTSKVFLRNGRRRHTYGCYSVAS